MPHIADLRAHGDPDVPVTHVPATVGASRWALPDAARADPDGVVGVGADLEPATLVEAYRHGIFPWPHDEMPLPWFSPDPRALIGVQGMHVSRSMRRTLRRCGWTTTLDHDFDGVVAACADRVGEGTWITPAMTEAYRTLHRLGWAHSLEVWDRDALIGGVYGVHVGGIFTGESMFHHATDASKVALLDLCRRLADAGGRWLDVQLATPHLITLGAVELPRSEFLDLLAALRDEPVAIRTDRLDTARLLPGDVA